MQSMNLNWSEQAPRLLLAAGLALALVWGDARAQARFSIGQDGAEVTDNQTGLIWRRCSEGQTFSAGICSGSAAAFTHEAALLRATSQNGWRLPNVKELSSIVDRNRENPSIDIAAFPSTPGSYFWSSSPNVGNAGTAWFVYFRHGFVWVDSRLSGYHVRLVRNQVVGPPVLSAAPRVVAFGGSTTLTWNTAGVPIANCALSGPLLPTGLPDREVGSFVVSDYSGRRTYRLRCFDLETVLVVEQIPTGG